MKLEVDKLAQVDCGYWATMANKIRLQKGYYTLEGGREYLEEPMSSKFRRRCYMKSTQGGGSMAEILKSFHGMIYGYLPYGVLYLFPSDKSMLDYSKGVMGPIIQSNPCIKKWVKSGKGTDAASLKTVNGANLYMRGANLSKKIEDEAESTELKAISVDKLVMDEIELMDKFAIAKAAGRFGDSEVKEEVYIGNPGIPGRGIDEVFSLSDQRHWFRKCSHCNEWTCAELYFMEDCEKCVGTRDDGTGYIRCQNCEREVFVESGHWVPAERHKSDYMHGYRWSYLTTPNHDPLDVLEAFKNPPQGNLSDVYRLQLGLAHIDAENRLVTSQVFACCGQDIMANRDPGPCAFGLDVGKTCHLVIGKRLDTKRYEIVKLARLPGDGDWKEISEMIRRFNCKSGVIDIRPYESAARRFQVAAKMRVFLCEYSETTTLSRSYNNKTGIVKVNRTEICDDTHALVTETGRLTIPHISPEVRIFAEQVCDPARQFDEKKGIYRYKGSEDHYRHALNYFLLAVDKIGIARAGRDWDWSYQPKRYPKVMNEYARL
jgi:hypothetical protein